MSDQFSMFDPMTSGDTASAISSRASASGATRSVSPDGLTTGKSGPAPVPASHSARPAKAKRSTTRGIFGQSGFDLSTGAGQPSSSESRSQQPPLLAELLAKSQKCRKCGIERPYSAYYVNSKGHRRSICMECMKDRSRLNKRENPERTKAAFASWRALHRGRALVTVAKFRARQKGIPFDLDPDEIQGKIDGGVCELTGIPFDLTTPKAWNAPSLDQIVPGAGYTKANVRVVLYSVNVMANVWGQQRIVDVAKAIMERRKERSNALSRTLAAKLKETTDKLGSTLFTLTWTEHITPSGHVIPRLVASEPRIEGSVCIGWPTPTTEDHKRDGPKSKARLDEGRPLLSDLRLRNLALLAGWQTPQLSDTTGGGQAKRSDGRANLNDFAMLAGWGTPKPRDYRSENEASLMREGHPPDLNKMVLLAGWKTPCVPNGGRISGNPSDIGQHRDGTKAQIGLENEARLSGWGTPRANDAEKRGQVSDDPCNGLVSEANLCAVQSTDSGPGPIGFLLGRNGWEIVPACGQLNAEHSRWLMGLPRVWDDCGVTAMASSRKWPKRS